MHPSDSQTEAVNLERGENARTGGSLPVVHVEVTDCWNRIGTYGDSLCAELPKFVHCRNCPVYSAAGARLLDQPLPADYRNEWTRHVARKRLPVAAVKISVVLFRIGGEWLALPASVVQEVAEPRPVHTLPNRRPGVAVGVINVRGELLICVSLGLVLGLEAGPGEGLDRLSHGLLLATVWQGKALAFPVNEVHGIHRFDSAELRDPPATLAGSGAGFTRHLLPWGGRLAGCLDAESLFATLNRSLA